MKAEQRTDSDVWSHKSGDAGLNKVFCIVFRPSSWQARKRERIFEILMENEREFFEGIVSDIAALLRKEGDLNVREDYRDHEQETSPKSRETR